MPVILISKTERLQLQFPAQPTETQRLWQDLRVTLLQDGVMPTQFHALDMAIGTALPDDFTTVYYHRPTYTEQQELYALATDRGQVNFNALWMETCKRVVDGWENLYGADLQVIPVPSGALGADRRAKIAAIVEQFPSGVRQTIAAEALSDLPGELLSRWRAQWSAASGLPTNGLAPSSPVSIADARNGAPPSVTPADSTPATTGN